MELYSKPYDEKMVEWRRRGAVDKAKNIQKLLGGKAAEIQRVIEVGSGTGDVLRNIAAIPIGKEFVGIEIGNDRLKETAGDQSGITFSYYDGNKIDFPDASFDLVYATHVLEHVTNERAFLHEMRRVTRRYVYLEVPLEIHRRTSASGLNRTLQIGHINAYDFNSFMLKLETSGLSVIATDLFDHSLQVHQFGKSRSKALAIMMIRKFALASGIGRPFLSYHCGALCVPAARLDI